MVTLTPKTIRHAVCELLAPREGDPATRAGRNVYPSRVAAISPRNMPAALVYTARVERSEDAPYNQTLGPMRRSLTLIVEAAVAGEAADDDADEFADEIEALLDANPTLGGAVEAVHWTGTDYEPLADGEEYVVVAAIAFTVIYRTDRLEGSDYLDGWLETGDGLEGDGDGGELPGVSTCPTEVYGNGEDVKE